MPLKCEKSEVNRVKKFIITAAAVLILSYGDLLPFENMDAGELCIVETLFVEEKNGVVTLLSGDLQGNGKDFASAAENMEETAPGRLFLRQLKRIVFCQDAQERVNIMAIPNEIPLGAAIYVCEGPAKEMLEQQEDLEKRLEVREQEKHQTATLAQLQNRELKEENGEA